MAKNGKKLFSVGNSVLSNFGISWDYITAKENGKTTFGMFGCYIRNYKSGLPITLLNPNAVIQTTGCHDKKSKWLGIISFAT